MLSPNIQRWILVLFCSFAAVSAQAADPLIQPLQAYSRQHATVEQNLSAGAYLMRADGSFCTSGFPVVDDFTGMRAYTTAGHCGNAGADNSHESNNSSTILNMTDANGGYLGHLLAYRWGFVESKGLEISWSQETDAALVVDILEDGGIKPVPYIYVGGSNSAVRQYIHDYRDPQLGDSVCFGGAATGENCNGVVTRVNVATTIYDATGVGMPMTGLVEVRSWDGSVLAQPGDSGGPVYVKESIGLNQVITGVGAIEGGISEAPSSTAYFLPVSHIVPEGWSLIKADCSWSWFVYSCR